MQRNDYPAPISEMVQLTGEQIWYLMETTCPPHRARKQGQVQTNGPGIEAARPCSPPLRGKPFTGGLQAEPGEQSH